MTRRTSRWWSAAAVAGVALLLPVAAGAAGSRARAELHAFLGTDTPLLRAWVDRIYGWLTHFLTLVRQWLA